MQSISDYLTSRNVQFKTEGKNTSQGWIQIPCIFPGCADPSTHLGINLTSGVYNCWACGAKGHVTKIVQEIDGISYEEAKKISDLFSSKEKEEKTNHVEFIQLPKEISKEFPDLHSNYLKKRGYNPNFVIEKYNLYSCFQMGTYSYRIIIPIYMNNKLVSFTAKDVTNQQKVPYKNLPAEQSFLSVKESLYGIDFVKRKKAIIVEGPLDMWRIGDGAIATFGIQFTHSQVYSLIEKELEEIIILYDYEEKAIKQAKKLANILSLFIPKVEVWELDQGDPDTMNEADLREVKRFLMI